MVKRIIVLAVVFMCTSFFYVLKAQIADLIKCDEYFKDLHNTLSQAPILNLWSQAPILKEENAPVLLKLYNEVLNDSCNTFIATLIIDTIGTPVCFQIYPEIRNDSIKNEIMKLLYQLQFDPAIGYKRPVMSYYPLIINSKRYEMYKNMSKQRKKRKFN